MLLKRSLCSSVAVVFSVGALAGCTADDDGSSGSDEEVAEQTGALVPVAPTLISPQGGNIPNLPTYMWNAVADANDYLLWVDDGIGNRLKNLVVTKTAAGCDGGVGQCITTPPVSAYTNGTPLADGFGGKWWVRARNADGTSPFSAPLSFGVNTPSPTQPAAPCTTLEPTGGPGISTTPTYKWNPVIGAGAAETYTLWVDDYVTKRKVKLSYSPTAAGCLGGGVCSVTPTTVLAIGPAKFWVEARNFLNPPPPAPGNWSAVRKFTVGNAPPAPVLTNPTGMVVTTTPTFEWNASPTATEYTLFVDGNGAPGMINQVYSPATANCASDTTCSVPSPLPLPVGAAKFFVKAKNVINSTWSAARNFTVDNADECALNTDNCDPAATCTNTAGSFTCACPAGQIGNGTTCSCDLAGKFAMKITQVVEWDAVPPVLSGGSATVFSWAINTFSVNGSNVTMDSRACGGTSPTLCNPLLLEAYTQTVPDNIWDLPSMPVSQVSFTLNDPDPGDAFVTPTQAVLLGLSLNGDPSGTGPWPTVHSDPLINWLDPDADSVLGTTQYAVTTGTAPMCNNWPYTALPQQNPFITRIDRVYAGSRFLGNFNGTINSCNAIKGNMAGPATNGQPQQNVRVRGCRLTNGSACPDATVTALDNQGNGSGQRTTSTQFSMVRLSNPNTPCATVRGMTFP